MASGAGDFDGALGGLLSADVFEVDEELLRFAEQGFVIGFDGDDAVAGVDEVDHVEQGADGVDFDASDHGGFLGVGFGNDHAGDFASPGFEGDGEGAADAANASVQREFTDKKAVGDFFLGQAAVGTDDAEGHGQVESGTFFLDVSGGEIDGDLRGWDVVAAIFQRGADAVTALPDGGVGQADGVEMVLVGLDAGAVDLDLNDVGVDAVDGGAESLIEHRWAPSPHFSRRERARNGGTRLCSGTRSPELPDTYLTWSGPALAVTSVTTWLWKKHSTKSSAMKIGREYRSLPEIRPLGLRPESFLPCFRGA